MQTTARRNGIPIDTLAFEHGIVNLDESEINGPPKEGVYIKGLFLEGMLHMHLQTTQWHQCATPLLPKAPGATHAADHISVLECLACCSHACGVCADMHDYPSLTCHTMFVTHVDLYTGSLHHTLSYELQT